MPSSSATADARKAPARRRTPATGATSPSAPQAGVPAASGHAGAYTNRFDPYTGQPLGHAQGAVASPPAPVVRAPHGYAIPNITVIQQQQQQAARTLPGPAWGAVVQFVAAGLAVLVTGLFLAAHQALDRITPDETAATTYLVLAGVTGLVALGVGIAGAVQWRGALALIAIAGVVLVPFLLAKGSTFGSAGCNDFNGPFVETPCNPDAQIAGPLWLITLLFVAVAGGLGGALWSSRPHLSPGLAFGIAGAATFGFTVTAFMLLGQVHSLAVKAASANQPHRVPGVAPVLLLAALAGLALLRRRLGQR